MLYAESGRSRRFVGCLKRGKLLEALLEFCREHDITAGTIRAHGVLSDVELANYDPASGEYLSSFEAEECVDLVALTGTISTLGPETIVSASAQLAYALHGQCSVVGGQLRSGYIHYVEFVVDTFDDVKLERGLDPKLGFPAIKSIDRDESAAPAPKVDERVAPSRPAAQPEPQKEEVAPRTFAPTEPSAPPTKPQPEPVPKREPEPKVEPLPPRMEVPPAPKAPRASAADWAAAAAEAKSIVEDIDDDDDDDDVELQSGDILLHPRLGECTVVRVDDDVAAYIRLPQSRKISKLALTLVDLKLAGERNGKRLIKVSPAG
ncbi:MAG: DUF296 domain-containing protein [Myxococcales bacterium]|nr:DUF296 domain-containing protein [Myxococcales bacterium]